MKTAFSARKRHYLAGAIIFSIMVALIAGTAACIPSGAEYTPMVAASYHVVGLKSDGTVVPVGHNWWGECKVGSWDDITPVAAGGDHTVPLRSGHTVITGGSDVKGKRQ